MSRNRAVGVASTIDLHGLLVVDKPLGWSSMEVIRRVRRAIALGRAESGLPPVPMRRIKVGHAGTLDPLATGVVLCCVGRATKAVSTLMGQTKVYQAEVDLSAFTTTDDREGPREEVSVAAPSSDAAVDKVLAAWVGMVTQRPPVFSAVHVRGRRAYQRARAGEPLDIPARPVRIDVIERLTYSWPMLTLRITCGKGTYIRSLARDLGLALGTGGHLASLRRIASGPWTLDHAIDAHRLERAITQSDLRDVPTMSAEVDTSSA